MIVGLCIKVSNKLRVNTGKTPKQVMKHKTQDKKDKNRRKTVQIGFLDKSEREVGCGRSKFSLYLKEHLVLMCLI